MPDFDKAAKYYQFIKWFKANYNAYYILYGMYVAVPTTDMQIRVKRDYIAPEDKQKMEEILEEYNSITV